MIILSVKPSTPIRDLLKPLPKEFNLISSVNDSLNTHPLEAYQKGGMVAAEINAILAAEFCQDLLAPVVEVYEDEKARILGSV